MIARRLLLFVRPILFFVDNQQREIGDRCKHRRPRSDHDTRIATLDPVPLLGALVIGQAGMQDGDFVAEDLNQIGRHRRSEPDFRHQQNGGAPLFQHLAHGREINRRLAGAGYAVEQHAGKLARRDALENLSQRFFLRDAEFKFKRRAAGLELGRSKALRLVYKLHQSAPYQSSERSTRNFKAIKRVDRHPSASSSQRVNQSLLILI